MVGNRYTVVVVRNRHIMVMVGNSYAMAVIGNSYIVRMRVKICTGRSSAAALRASRSSAAA